MIKGPRGTYDMYGDKIEVYQYIIEKIEKITRQYNVKQIITPNIEYTELFLRGVGDTTDIVNKEMYTFLDKGDRSITLRPEGTAGVARCLIENKLYGGLMPLKYYYINTNYRYEKPQAGRFREFRQFGIEYFGAASFKADIEVISLAYSFFREIGIKSLTLKINSLGDRQCRENYNKIVKKYIDRNLERLCPTCKERAEKNPLRVFDCKNIDCQEIMEDAPTILSVLGDECRSHFDNVIKGLEVLGIPYEIDERLVRGLDYYTKTVFEFISNDIGAQGTVCGGGRYDHLIEECGGPKVPAIGFGLGLERLMLTIESLGIDIDTKSDIDIFIATTDQTTDLVAMGLAKGIRDNGFSVVTDIVGKGLKAQMKYADKISAKYSTVIGTDEINNKTLIIKDMVLGEKTEISFDGISEFLGGKDVR